MKSLLLINGPNLNLLGTREPNVYGAITLNEIEHNLQQQAQAKGFQLTCFQSNHEGKIIDQIHIAKQNQIQGIVINPGAYTHTSIAIRDALLAVDIPFVEVHLSNIYKRETFRHHSYLSDVACGVIAGLGWQGYSHALHYLLDYNQPLNN